MKNNFKDDLERGQEIERQVGRAMGWTKLSGFYADFKRNDGLLIELKADFYNPNKTGNFFFEVYSNLEHKTTGGPWRAKQNGCSLYCYYFVKTKQLYTLNLDSLLSYLEEHIKTHSPYMLKIENESWITTGFLMPITLLKPFYTLQENV